jgi:hypothetical protein
MTVLTVIAMARRGFRCCPAPTAQADDIQLAHYLLHGYVENNARGLPQRIYLEDDGEARRALARLLRSELPLERAIRIMLARLIDPDKYQQVTNPQALGISRGSDEELNLYAVDHIVRERRITFTFRSRVQREAVDSEVIGKAVADHRDANKTFEEAVSVVAADFEMSEGAVKKKWAKSSQKARRRFR